MRKSKHFFLITGEPSGDALGGPLMVAIRALNTCEVEFSGVGGEHMSEQGMDSLFALSELSLMGISEVVTQIPRLFGLVNRTVAEIVAQQPDVLVIIDSPDFTHAVARRVRKRAPHIKIINYVSPTVWAWRPWRAKRMARYIDKVLAIFPFEVEVHRDLSGPPCVYVGHPLVEQISRLRGNRRNKSVIGSNPKLLVMPGSRSGEIKRLMKPFGETLARLQEVFPDIEAVLPVVPSVRDSVEKALENWRFKPTLIHAEDEKIAAFHSADAALVASGTATLELSLAQVPMVAAYRVDWMSASLSWMLQIQSVLLPNLIAGRRFVPEFLQIRCTAANLVRETMTIFTDNEIRQRQLDGFQIVAEKLSLPGESPSQRAATEIMEMFN